MAHHGKRYPGQQTPPVPRKKAQAVASAMPSDALGQWLDALHGNQSWSRRGNGTFIASKEKVKAS